MFLTPNKNEKIGLLILDVFEYENGRKYISD